MANKVEGKTNVQFVCLFAQEHVDFRISELLSVSGMFGFEVVVDRKDYRKENPYLEICLPNKDCAKNLLSRTVSIKSVYELWGQGENLTALKDNILQYPPDKMNTFTSSDKSFKISIESFNKKLSISQQREFIDQFQFLPFQGCVNLTAPDNLFALLLDYGDDPNEAPPIPQRLFFGRLVGHGQRHLFKQYSLKTRRFIGNTSMDPQLSFLMANQGQVRSGSLVFDPFVGTGSVLVACAHFGAHVIGSDIDYTLLHGRGRSSRANRKGQWRGRDENFRANFAQYGLDSYFVDILIADAGRLGLREIPLFDAIITDPPYGIREGARKLDTNMESQEENDSADQTSPCSAVRGCRLSEILTALLDLGARYLVLHGRLVYWLPIYRPSYSDEFLPSHPCLRLVANSEQCLSRHVSRRLITMEKIKEHTVGGQNMSVVHQKFLESCDNFRDNYFSQQST
ncbi:tRNA (guanine(10)-N2)-methyltransferase homolog isoform X1 [Stylophora pistillata]|uniref:tRNA (guanine(10)-N2)-methyltransferase homolog isoform X1 n=1 Tax=Stylophora pistillata TaxID=50429 RepID=UPI000C03AE4E|nr:tRNA (guanine(10)-N2)-methyltransferase homolog isoform X1 [Stylophora pistillata]